MTKKTVKLETEADVERLLTEVWRARFGACPVMDGYGIYSACPRFKAPEAGS